MPLSYFLDEFKKGLRETSKYILSHHEPKSYYKCYSLKLKSNVLHICSRCSGIFFGILLGLLLNYLDIFDKQHKYLIILIFPSFTLLNWALTTFTKRIGSNFARSLSGVLLGIAYAFGLSFLFGSSSKIFVICVGLFYSIISLTLIVKKAR